MNNYPKIKDSHLVSKKGLAYVKAVFENNKCIFNEIHQENDFGIDAIVEFSKDGFVTGKNIAVQVKSGNSYYNEKKGECFFEVGSHYEYWKNYSLPVYGIVYIPKLDKAYWVDIKFYLKNLDKRPEIINFQIINTLNFNEFSNENFEKIFKKFVIKEVPEFNLEEAKELFKSDNYILNHYGAISLFKTNYQNIETWELFIDHIKQKPEELISGEVVYYLAHIEGHTDIFYKTDVEKIPRTKIYKLLECYSEPEVLKLLNIIDEENSLHRGSIGQCIEAVIRAIPNYKNYLKNIMENIDYSEIVRQHALMIWAKNSNKDDILLYLPLVKNSFEDTYMVDYIIETVEENDEFGID